MRTARSHRLAVAVIFGALTLAGCGRRGPLDLPDSATPAPVQANAKPADPKQVDAKLAAQQRVFQADEQPGLIQSPDKVYEEPAGAKLNFDTNKKPPRPINAPPVAKPSTFVLDPLL